MTKHVLRNEKAVSTLLQGGGGGGSLPVNNPGMSLISASVVPHVEPIFKLYKKWYNAGISHTFLCPKSCRHRYTNCHPGDKSCRVDKSSRNRIFPLLRQVQLEKRMLRQLAFKGFWWSVC